MDIKTAKTIIGDTALTDETVSALILKAQKLAKNQHFWHPDDNPSDPELERFYDRYEFEIYDIAKEIYSSDSRDGLTSFSELGVSRTWGKTGKESVSAAVASIPAKTYVS